MNIKPQKGMQEYLPDAAAKRDLRGGVGIDRGRIKGNIQIF